VTERSAFDDAGGARIKDARGLGATRGDDDVDEPHGHVERSPEVRKGRRVDARNASADRRVASRAGRRGGQSNANPPDAGRPIVIAIKNVRVQRSHRDAAKGTRGGRGTHERAERCEWARAHGGAHGLASFRRREVSNTSGSIGGAGSNAIDSASGASAE